MEHLIGFVLDIADILLTSWDRSTLAQKIIHWVLIGTLVAFLIWLIVNYFYSPVSAN